ncbi:cell division protein ZapE [Pseudomonadales bacterium]|jgi:cell division protein ZapE|nr:cell division protein ZapE [Pseudomonadales bacterium]MDC1085233.1 cell division protein ZapE [Pseudomonadales bacterium]
MGPLDLYQTAVSKGDIQSDVAQLQAMERLQSLYLALTKQENEPGLIAKLFAKPKRELIPGLYFWGGVGRGKTFLMDLFFDSLPFEQKSRMHFHRFMRHVHHALTDLQGEADPLRKIALDFADKNRVLCFDEFFVSDITDAMILAGLLEVLFKNGVTLVATSNVEPVNLYENGLQRSKFLPAIALIEKNTQILNVDSGTDYRLRVLESAEIYHYPLDRQADEVLLQSFNSLSPDAGKADIVLDIEGREIKTRFCGDGVVWFDFPEICEGPRSQNDYIEIAMLYQTVLVSNLPRFTEQSENAARRFISLVDEFYDHSVKLIISAESPILDIYQGERLKFEFQRTESRLQEMQSNEYLGREHKP